MFKSPGVFGRGADDERIHLKREGLVGMLHSCGVIYCDFKFVCWDAFKGVLPISRIVAEWHITWTVSSRKLDVLIFLWRNVASRGPIHALLKFPR